MLKKKSTFKFDEEAVKKGVEILRKIDELTTEFKELGEKLKRDGKYKEANLIGGLVIGIYSPIGEVARCAIFGHDIVDDGLIRQLCKEMKKGESEPLPFPFLFKQNN